MQNKTKQSKTRGGDTDLNREFSIKETQMAAAKHLKKYSTSLAIKKTEIKTTLRSHLTPVIMAMIH